MKKHDEGYVLPLVLVVMIVMCLIATSLMSFSLQNLKSQQASIDRMVEKYEVEGVIEIIEVKLSQLTNISSVDDIKNQVPMVSGFTITREIGTDAGYVIKLNVQRSDNPKVTIECNLILTMENNSVKSITYASYNISNIGGNAE